MPASVATAKIRCNNCREVLTDSVIRISFVSFI